MCILVHKNNLFYWDYFPLIILSAFPEVSFKKSKN